MMNWNKYLFKKWILQEQMKLRKISSKNYYMTRTKKIDNRLYMKGCLERIHMIYFTIWCIRSRQPIVHERLFGTNTPDGKVNHVSALIAPFQNVYYVKGRAGTGKSVFMKEILNACKSYGYDIEMYRCSFDPSSVDMIIVRDLDFCVFDSTPPHEFFPDSDQ